MQWHSKNQHLQNYCQTLQSAHSFPYKNFLSLLAVHKFPLYILDETWKTFIIMCLKTLARFSADSSNYM